MSGTVLTNKGLALITKLVAASTELQISRVAVGTGRVPSGVDPQTMVDLNEYKMDAQIESYGVSPDQSDVAYIAAQVSSIGVSAGFAVTEAGVFATDPDVGEILYAYLDLTEDPQYIYAETDAISKFAEITFNVLIGSVAKVTAYVSPGALTKKVDFNAFKESVETPEFDDSGTVSGISSFPDFLNLVKSKMNFFQFFRNFKAGLQFVLHAGQIVNNCVTDNAGLPLSAAQGKALMDKYTQLYSDLNTTNNNLSKLNGKMLGSNYVMNYSDFSDLSVNVYSVETFATTPSGNAPENNVGDFRITRLGMNNSKYNTLILTSPRYKTSVSMSQEFYVGNFWDGIWMGWERLANKSALDNLTSLYNTIKANYEKGSTFLDDISPLSFPSQLKHAGFYKLPTMTADVNADAGSETMTEYTTGDFYGLLLGADINTTDGCAYGTLIVSSPRIKSAIWVGNIWKRNLLVGIKLEKVEDYI